VYIATWVRFGGKCIYSIQFQPLWRLPIKIFLLKFVEIWRSYDRNKNAQFLRHGVFCHSPFERKVQYNRTPVYQQLRISAENSAPKSCQSVMYEFWKSVNIWQNYDHSVVSPFFLTHAVVVWAKQSREFYCAIFKLYWPPYRICNLYYTAEPSRIRNRRVFHFTRDAVLNPQPRRPWLTSDESVDPLDSMLSYIYIYIYIQ